mmetsp:Transcript_23544/g.38685  ORF Transcript_23544/g.38685 Transcript_23544/m.38685 type:complete len:182 (+) Transcript_23544:1343-1888(+)
MLENLQRLSKQRFTTLNRAYLKPILTTLGVSPGHIKSIAAAASPSRQAALAFFESYIKQHDDGFWRIGTYRKQYKSFIEAWINAEIMHDVPMSAISTIVTHMRSLRTGNLFHLKSLAELVLFSTTPIYKTIGPSGNNISDSNYLSSEATQARLKIFFKKVFGVDLDGYILNVNLYETLSST